ncbi:MAG TPA: hypothetical protein VF502_18810 [Stellaceae bacterium]
MKGVLFASVSIVALTLGARSLLRERQPSRPASDLSRARVKTWNSPPLGAASRSRPHGSAGESVDVAEVTRNFLLFFIVPLWACVGIADWLCHRATSIETTTGAKESIIHLLMLLEMGMPVLMGLFLEITSPVIALMIASFFLHEATALWDVSYAVSRREVPPIEQHVHSFLELLPLLAVSFIVVLHWPRFRALFVRNSHDPGPAFRLKEKPLPPSYSISVLASMTLLEGLPYLEELWRCLRASGFRLVPPAGRGERSTAAARA